MENSCHFDWPSSMVAIMIHHLDLIIRATVFSGIAPNDGWVVGYTMSSERTHEISMAIFYSELLNYQMVTIISNGSICFCS